ncbi:hypothetical protein SDC9_175633 [bioreactor metagenome]|uniref:Uncharacterized protein n=1 Tax=bioreactor metagenome TaxID=1076179 RepID=A0A645GX17_9ZZZZ
MAVMDHRPKHDAGSPLRHGLTRQLHRAAHAVTKAGGLGQEKLHAVTRSPKVPMRVIKSSATAR